MITLTHRNMSKSFRYNGTWLHTGHDFYSVCLLLPDYVTIMSHNEFSIPFDTVHDCVPDLFDTLEDTHDHY